MTFISRVVGDLEYIDANHDMVAQAIYDLTMQGKDHAIAVHDLQLNFDDFDAEMQDKVDRASEDIMAKLEEMQKALVSKSGGGSTADRPLINLLLDDEGRLNPQLSIGEVDGHVVTLEDLIRRLFTLEENFKDVNCKIDAKGGMRVGSLYFASKNKKELRDIIMSERSDGKGVQCFVCALTIFAHGHGRTLSMKDKANMKNLSETLCLADALVIDAARSPMCPPYTGTAKSSPRENPSTHLV